MASIVYNRSKGNLAYTAADVRALLLKDTYTPDPDHDYVSDVSAHELSGGGYVRKTLANKTMTLDDTNDRNVFDADDITWSALSATGPVRYVCFYVYDAADSAAMLVAVQQLTGGDFTPNGGSFTYEIPALGVYYAS